MLSQLDSVALLAEAGLPRHHAVFSEGLRRLFNRLLPSAMAVTDSSRLMISLFAHSRDVERFLELPQSLFERLSMICSLRLPRAVDRAPLLACRAICARHCA